MVMSGRSVHITTHFPERLASTSLVTDELAEGRRMDIEIIWDRVAIKLATSGYAVRHIIDCAARPACFT